MNSCNKKDSSPSDTKFTAELLPKTPTSKQTTHSLTTQSTTQKQKITPTARINSPNTQLCKGTSVSTGRPCKRTVLSDNFCYHHKDQITGKNMFGVPTTPKKNNLPKNETDYSDEVIDLTNDMAPSHSQNGRREKLVGIENQLNSLSLNNSKKDRLAQDDSKIKNSEASSTVITINLNKLKVQITEELELSKKSTQVSISSEDNNSNRDQTPPPIRSDIDRAEFTQKKSLSSSTKWVQTDVNNQLPLQDRLPIESPACVDDSFLETTNKELFQTPTLVTPSSELVLAPLLSISPSQPKSPLDSLFDSGRIKPEEELKSSSHPKIVHTPDLKPPSTPTPTKTRMISYTSYESHVSITGNQNVTPGSITPTRSRQIDLTTPTHSRNPIDLTGDYYNPSPYNSPSNLCQGRIKNGKICNRRTKPSEEFCHQHRKEFIEPAEELEKAVFVPGRARLTYLRFGEWIKPDLLPETKNSLRSEMEKPISESDEPGFIYAYRLLEGPNSEKNSQYTLYKVGRTTNVHRRLYQWAKQCGYRPELIEMFPNVDISFSSFDKEEGECSPDGKSEISKCKYTHRAERLVHIELGARFKADIEKCKNCGNIHREWFKVTSSDSSNGTNVMHGWDEVRKIIVHWISYVEKVYGVG